MTVMVIRTILLYGLIILGLRIMGKRQLGELQPTELVATILISNIATLPIEDKNIPFLAGVMPILTLVCFEVFISAVSLKWQGARKFISGSPRTVIRDGIIDQKELRDLRFSVDDLMAQLRTVDVFDIRDVAFAIVETTGKLSVYQKFEARTVSTQMLQLTPIDDATSPPTLIINNGIVNYDGLTYCNLSERWLYQVLAEKKLSTKDIFLMTCDRRAEYHIVVKG